MPWEYNPDELITLCEQCHKREKEEGLTSLKNLDSILKRSEFLTGYIDELATAFDIAYHEKVNKYELIESILFTILNKEIREMIFNKIKEYE